jgi:uncharacterized membrane protein SpoIIM required for sporulation
MTGAVAARQVVRNNLGMDFDQFLRHRRPRWQRLNELLQRIDTKGFGCLAAREADEFYSLYRLTSSDLNLVQTRSANSVVLTYLEELVARAYAQLQVPQQTRMFRAWWLILRYYFPAALRSEARLVLLSMSTLLIGTICGLAATMAQPTTAEYFLPSEHLQQSPRERVASLEDAERHGHRSIAGADDNAAFAVYLFNNNIRVSILAFALGLTFGVGTLIVLFYNGAMLGSLMALYILDGQTRFFVAWVGPHGAIELPSVIIAGTAGLMIAARQINRRRGTLLSQIRAIRPKLADILIGCASLLVIAGCIEGGFSQINEPTISYTFKIIVAAFIFSALITYLFIIPVKPRPSTAIDTFKAVAAT